MKKKLIALLVSITLLGGVGTTAFASIDKNTNIESINLLVSNKNGDNLTENVEKSEEVKVSEDSNEKEELSIKKQGFFGYIWFKIKKIFISINDFFKDIIGGNKTEIEEGNSGENPDEDIIQPDNNTSGNDEDKPLEDSKDKVEVPGNAGDSKEEIETPPTQVAPPSVEKPPVVETPQVTPPTVNKPQVPTSNEKFMAEVERMIFEKVNAERAKAGAAALSYNSTMEKYARIKSQDMGDRGYFDHNDPEGNLITVQMKNDGVSYSAWGENIAYIGGVSDANALANQFMTNWMNSSGHRKNILSTNFTGIGVGVYKIGNKVYATQEFFR
ncbi:CAP domain-containing protein [Clostridium paraputrificum]|uniref:CAP domain-containing protein n=1 Tax=Clostridium TaxID=1485 RepID=UPI003D335707